MIYSNPILLSLMGRMPTEGLRRGFFQSLNDNEPMIRLNQAMGFTLEPFPDDPDLIRVRLSLS